MDRQTETATGIAVWNWWRIAARVLPFAVAFGAFLAGETVAIAKIDLWLAIDSFQAAARNSLYVSAVGLWLRFCVVGAAVYFVLKARGRSLGAGFFGFWCAVSLALALLLLLVDLWIYRLQFSDAASAETQRWMWLATLYARVIVYYLAVRLLLGASCLAGTGIGGAWTATTTLQSLGWFLALLAIKLFVDKVIVDLISFVPVIAPFWFIPDELSPMRYFVGIGVDIVAQSCGVFLYVAFWIVADRRICPAGPDHPARG